MGTVYEHRDHNGLPVGTRIYYIGNGTYWVRPGEAVPVERKPDVVIIPDSAHATISSSQHLH